MFEAVIWKFSICSIDIHYQQFCYKFSLWWITKPHEVFCSRIEFAFLYNPTEWEFSIHYSFLITEHFILLTLMHFATGCNIYVMWPTYINVITRETLTGFWCRTNRFRRWRNQCLGTFICRNRCPCADATDLSLNLGKVMIAFLNEFNSKIQKNSSCT